mgnify:CR=1 FL=1
MFIKGHDWYIWPASNPDTKAPIVICRRMQNIKIIGKSGVDGFLVGTSIMKSDNIEKKIKELTSVRKWI